MEVKCKACDGSGTSNWCVNGTFKTCDVCGGTGHVEYPMMSMNGDEYTGEWERHECEVCGGTGEIQQTNEEWFIGLSTEEKAEFLAKKCCEISCKFFLGEAEEIFSKYWVEWLKQPHTQGGAK